MGVRKEERKLECMYNNARRRHLIVFRREGGEEGEERRGKRAWRQKRREREGDGGPQIGD